MNADRWKAVKSLFEAALAVDPGERARLLDEKCSGDDELRREVDSLLAAHTESGDFLDKPAAPAERLRQDFGSLIGQSLGPYKVIELIGEGGMGAVYLALDERLKRKVAIKTLHASLAWDPELIERLKREARAESAINHPNICTVFDIGEWKGVPYIVMEYLEGEPLRSRMKGQPIPAEEISRIAGAVAGALDAAHAKGVIHRDVKPGNIFLTKDGQVKIMDFGVAKQMPRLNERTAIKALTQPWIRIGTVTHMSPEQARGEKIDGRSDLFSLGSVIYEMATGRAPFRGEGPHAVMDAIIGSQPAPPTSLAPGTPRDLERIIFKALEKDPALRYQTGGDLAADLKRLHRDSSSSKMAAVSASRRAGKRWWWLAAAAAAAIAIFAGLRPRAQYSVTPAKTVSLASLRGIRENPVISPDGDRVAFSWTGESSDLSDKEIYVQFIGTGQPLKLTAGPGRAEAPVWSPDGRQIAYVRTGTAKPGYYVTPSIPGESQLLRAAFDPPPRAGGTALDWAPDGKSLVIADRASENGLRTLFLHEISGETKPLGIEAPFVSNPAFSPDGSTLAFTMGPSFLSHDIYLMPATGGSPKRLTNDRRWIGGLTWTSDGSGIIFASRKVGPFALWSIPATGGAAKPVPQSGTDTSSPNIGRKSNRLVFARIKYTRNLWRVKLGDATHPKDLISSTRTSFQPDYSPNGANIVFASDRTGSHEIWETDSEGRHPQQLTSFHGAQTGSPRWSPDGNWVAFDSRPDGHSDIHVVAAAGAQQRPRRLTDHPSEDRTPTWSADGQSIYFISNRTGRNQLWNVPLAGGEARQITDDGATYAVHNPADGAIYYTNGKGLWKRSGGGAGRPELMTETFPLLNWRLWRGALCWGRPDAKGLFEIVGLNLADRKIAPVISLGQRATDFDTFAFAPSGDWLLYDRIDQVENEIVLMELQ